MTPRAARTLVASVWLVHDLYNKPPGGSPRHLAIVQSAPGLSGATGVRALGVVGLFEVALAVGILSGWALWPSRLRARLRRHPIPIEAHFDDCLTLTYALPPDVLRRLLPPGLELDTYGGYGFVAVALVQTRSLRPAGLPARCGQDFFLAGYRVFAHFRTANGTRLRGLRILRSDANRWSMVAGGNLLTHYNYHRCTATIDSGKDRVRYSVRAADPFGSLDITANLMKPALPDGSPFPSVRDARRYAGPLPFTFDYERETGTIVAIQATRTTWLPTPVAVDVRRLAFFEQPIFSGCTPILAAAFHVKDIDYRWERGVRHRVAEAAREIAS